MTGRQHQVAKALREDGWLVLERDPDLWTKEECDEVVRRLLMLGRQRLAITLGFAAAEPSAVQESLLGPPTHQWRRP